MASGGLALFFDLRRLLAVAGMFTPRCYAITNFADLRLSDEQRTLSRAFSR